MKIIAKALLALMLLTSLAACGDVEGDVEENDVIESDEEGLDEGAELEGGEGELEVEGDD